MKKLLVANRGEIAIRILRAADDLGLATVLVHSRDDASSLPVRRAGEAVALEAGGPAAYLDIDTVVAAAVKTGCDAVHPGYGFLAENAAFARACGETGVTFVGPSPDTLALLGDKARGRALAESCDVPVLAGTAGPATLDEAAAFLAGLGDGAAVMVKAVAGGGGRGMRLVRRPAELAEAYERCRSEAAQAFGTPDVLLEQFLPGARHIEVQIAGDGSGAVVHLGERECSLQRRHQKLIEMAPAPNLPGSVRDGLLAAAVRMATELRYAGLGTFEFLVAGDGRFAFIEANPRLQVEHTVTEEATGVDLVVLQLRLAGGVPLADLLSEPPPMRAMAVQARVNMETMRPDGSAVPTGGLLGVFEPPSGPGVRVDTFGSTGYQTSTRYDSLLAKVVAVETETGPAALAAVLTRLRRALSEFRVDGVGTNIAFLLRLLEHPDVVAGRLSTTFVDEHLAELVVTEVADPLAVLDHGKAAVGTPGDPDPLAFDAVPLGTVAVEAPLQGTVVSLSVSEGDAVHQGQQLLVMEAMKMEHVVAAPFGGMVQSIAAREGDTVATGQPLVFVEPADVDVTAGSESAAVDLDAVRPDLAEALDRHGFGYDENRPDAVERRRRTGQRTARENIDDLCDPGSFVEYGPLVIAAQRRRRTLDDLIARTPADGLIAGVGTVNGSLFPASPQHTRAVAMSYDYTVLAGTQGLQNHRKKDRMFELAERERLPVVFFTEGGGGRPGDTDGLGAAGLDCMAFNLWGRLSGLVPLIGIQSGRCFAGNAALLGCCDVVIAAENSNVGMGGPAMIEGGGLGVFRPDEVGPMAVQVPNGVVDIAVADEAEGVEAAKQYLSYFQGVSQSWEADDQRRLRVAIPENRLRIYDIRSVISTLADTGSVLELRRGFGAGMVTALIRIEGRPMGLIANNPAHLAGAIDSDGADKATRFMQLCDAFDLPILFLCDTPGIMVGPEVEKTALVRHASRMFVTGASITVPFFTIILRKGYGLGAQAMAGGSFKAPVFTVAWPTGEFGGMGLEGAVKLGYRNELAAVDDPAERKELFDQMVARMYEHGKAISTASYFEIDDVIDPLDSRRWVSSALQSVPYVPGVGRAAKKRPCIDTW